MPNETYYELILIIGTLNILSGYGGIVGGKFWPSWLELAFLTFRNKTEISQ